MKFGSTLNKNINQSSTLDANFYSDATAWEMVKEKVFAKSWNFIGDENELFNGTNNLYPFNYIENYLHEPLILSKGENDVLKCLSNVCTHRGFQLVDHPKQAKKISCQYHGRRFGLDGKMEFMPEFKEAEDFPRPCDHLHELQIKKWNQFLFTSLEPSFDFQKVLDTMNEKVGLLPIKEFRYAPEFSQDYLVHANWALYCDNFLEGFHIPFVHGGLNKLLDYGKYSTTCYEHCNLQIGYSDSGVECFKLPKNHPDYGENITAFYYWLFPNMMFNFYPWGLSINVVKPIKTDLTRVSFICYIYDEKIFEQMDAAALTDKVEREDEFVVEAVHKGLQSRFYKNGRFSPTREKGVHQFHCMLNEFLEI